MKSLRDYMIQIEQLDEVVVEPAPVAEEPATVGYAEEQILGRIVDLVNYTNK